MRSRMFVLVLIVAAAGARAAFGLVEQRGDDKARAKFEERKRQYAELRNAGERARLTNAAEFSAWFAKQNYPPDFKAEVERRVAIAIAAAELAWNDVQKLSDDEVLSSGLGAGGFAGDLIVVLRRVGRNAEARKLARRFAYRAEDDTEEEKRRDRDRHKFDESLEKALQHAAKTGKIPPSKFNPPSKLKIPRSSEGFSEATRIADAVKWFCEARDAEAAEQVFRRLAARPKPTESDLRRYRRDVYRTVGDLRAIRGDLDGAIAAHRLADELRQAGEWEFLGWRNVARALNAKLGVDGAVRRASGASSDLEAQILMEAARGPSDDVRRAEQAYRKLLPRLGRGEKVDVSAATFAAGYARCGDFKNAERVLKEALEASTIRCGEYDAESLLHQREVQAAPEAGDRLAALILELAGKDAVLSPKQKAGMKLAVAVFKARVGRAEEARALAAEARRNAPRPNDENFELVELLLGNPKPALVKVRPWMKDLSGFETLFEWELPQEGLEAILKRVETTRTSKDGPTRDTKNETIARIAARLGAADVAQEALRKLINDKPLFSPRIIRDCELDEYGWDLIRKLPIDESSKIRPAVAADLATSILGIRCGIQ